MIKFKEWILLSEAVYKGMVGVMELVKFHQVATPKEKTEFQGHLDAGRHDEAKKMLEKKLKFKFQ